MPKSPRKAGMPYTVAQVVHMFQHYDNAPGRDLIHDACDLGVIESYRTTGNHRRITNMGTMQLRELLEEDQLSERIAEAKRRVALSRTPQPLGRMYSREDALWHLCCTAEDLAAVRPINDYFWHEDLLDFVQARKGTIVVLRCIGNDPEPVWVEGEPQRGWRVLWPGEEKWKLGLHDSPPSVERESKKELRRLRDHPNLVTSKPIDLG